MSEIAVNNSQNVNIIFNSASVGERMLAFLIDSAIKILYFIVIYIFFDLIFNIDRLFVNLDSWSQRAIVGVIILPTLLYTIVCESLMEGQTIGKRLVKIKVIKIDGYQASFGDYLIRWVFRLVDILFLSGIIGVITIIMTKNNQRLGGIASGTTVISLKNKVNISHTILENIAQDYQPLFPQVIALSDNDIRIIKENFHKAIAINDKVIINQLCLKISEVTKIDLESIELTQKEFIKTILKDYNFHTGSDSQ